MKKVTETARLRRESNMKELQQAYFHLKVAVIHLARIENAGGRVFDKEKDPVTICTDVYGPLGAVARLICNRGGKV